MWMVTFCTKGWVIGFKYGTEGSSQAIATVHVNDGFDLDCNVINEMERNIDLGYTQGLKQNLVMDQMSGIRRKYNSKIIARFLA